MSTGELRVDGPTAVFELRMPMYEVAHVENPEETLLQNIRFGDGHMTRSSCQAEGDTYVCTANYEFPALLPDKLPVECTFFKATVPNHIHLLTASQGKNEDQLVFDHNVTAGELRFRPPTAGEIVLRDVTGGAWKLLHSFGALLFLGGIALAARTWREASLFLALFLIAQWILPPLAGRIPVTLAPGFFESALALDVAYLAVEVVFLAYGGGRWIAVAAAGGFEGLQFAGFPKNYLAGANVIQLVGAAALTYAAFRMPREWRRPAAGAAGVAGVLWFAVKLIR
jgi:hypothetical protein